MKFQEVKQAIKKYDLLVIFLDCAKGSVFFDALPADFKYEDDEGFSKAARSFEVSNDTFLELLTGGSLYPHPDMDCHDSEVFMGIDCNFRELMKFDLRETNLANAVARLTGKRKYYSYDTNDVYWDDAEDNWKEPSPKEKAKLKAQRDKEEAEEK